ncbi:MAG: TlpA family protein disulfide reductase, partial [Thermoanaerobaculia bacterium]
PGNLHLARKRLIAALLLALVTAVTLPASAEPSLIAELLTGHGIQPVTPPSPAPDFTLPLLAGGEGDLSASHGDWVVLTFFATWCGPCRSEMPTLERLHRGGSEEGLTVLAVSVDSRREPLGPFVAEHDLTLPVFWDQRGEVGTVYRATSIPVSYVIDPTGRIVGMARGARDWAAMVPMFDALSQAMPVEPEAPSHYSWLDGLELPDVLQPPTAEWSLPAETPRPGRPFTIEVRLSWSGRLEDYLPQPPQIPLPEGISRGRVAASSSSLDRRHLVRYQIELTAAEAGVYELDPIELRYLPALGDGPVAARVAGPTLEVAAAGLAGRSPAALAGLVAVLAAAGLWLHMRRRGAKAAPAEPPPWQRLRQQLDQAKASRLAGDVAAGYELLVVAARELEAENERHDLEQRLESVRFGGNLPDSAELEAIERRLERALTRLRPDPGEASRRGLRLRPEHPDSSPLTSKETSG